MAYKIENIYCLALESGYSKMVLGPVVLACTHCPYIQRAQHGKDDSVVITLEGLLGLGV